MKKDSINTKNNIKKAFIKLYKEKRIEKISIGEVAGEAKVYRGTFYYYFEDIYDLLSKIEEEFFVNTIDIVDKLMDGIFYNSIEEKVKDAYEFYKHNKEEYYLFLIERPNGALINRIKKAAKEKAVHKLGLDIKGLTMEEKYILEYVASAQFGIITAWIESGEEISIPELAKVIKMANLKGPVNCLLESFAKKLL